MAPGYWALNLRAMSETLSIHRRLVNTIDRPLYGAALFLSSHPIGYGSRTATFVSIRGTDPFTTPLFSVSR